MSCILFRGSTITNDINKPPIVNPIQLLIISEIIFHVEKKTLLSRYTQQKIQHQRLHILDSILKNSMEKHLGFPPLPSPAASNRHGGSLVGSRCSSSGSAMIRASRCRRSAGQRCSSSSQSRRSARSARRSTEGLKASAASEPKDGWREPWDPMVQWLLNMLKQVGEFLREI